VDPRLVAAVMKVESNYNRWARSPKGALGLMQLIPATGKGLASSFFDPAQNIEGGVRYLKFLSEKFAHNLDLQLAAYNAGENVVERWDACRRSEKLLTTFARSRQFTNQRTGGLVSASDEATAAAARTARAESPSRHLQQCG
jgi:hypothetical protein